MILTRPPVIESCRHSNDIRVSVSHLVTRRVTTNSQFVADRSVYTQNSDPVVFRNPASDSLNTFRQLSEIYRVAQKLAPFLYDLTLPNINRFSKFFHCQNQEKIRNNIITKDPTTPHLCRYTTLCPTKAPRRGV